MPTTSSKANKSALHYIWHGNHKNICTIKCRISNPMLIPEHGFAPIKVFTHINWEAKEIEITAKR